MRLNIVGENPQVHQLQVKKNNDKNLIWGILKVWPKFIRLSKKNF